jgi:hypothetical protein
MADYYVAWNLTSENEGPFSNDSWDMPTNWGLTLPFCKFWKIPITTVPQLKALSRNLAGEYLKQTIWAKVLNGYSGDQNLLNILFDCGFNKPAYMIEWFGWCLKKSAYEIRQAVDKFQIPKSWFAEIKDAKLFYKRFWSLWFFWSINSGHFKKAAAGLARRIWRFSEYGFVKPYENNGHYWALRISTNAIVKHYLKEYLSKNPFDPKKEARIKVLQNPVKSGFKYVFGAAIIGTIGYVCYHNLKYLRGKRR